jgi:hypothetical protein
VKVFYEEHFVSIYLSEIGLTKLVTTLRIYKKRNSRLNQLVKISGKTKIEIINYLIANADLEGFQKLEE